MVSCWRMALGNPPFPRILNRRRTRLSPWVELIEKDVQFKPTGPVEVYHCVTQASYVGMFVRTAGGQIPIVRQYRPSVEEYTWELPAGTVDTGETADEAARRELLEETGLVPDEMRYLGNLHPDTGRIQVDAYAYYVTTPFQAAHRVSEEGLTVRYVDHIELKQMIVSGEFRHGVHLSIYAAVLARGIPLD